MIDELLLNRIVLEYLDCQKSAKLLAQEYGLSAETLRRALRARGVSLRSSHEQRWSDKVFGRYDHAVAIKKAWERGQFHTERYQNTRSKKWRGADRRGTSNPFYGRKHAPATRAALAYKARRRSIPGKGEYGPEWTPELRMRVMMRDGHQCQLCGRNKGMLQVHHVDGDRTNNDLSNLITLCAACHLGYHGRGENAQALQAAGDELARMAGSARQTARAEGGDAAHATE